MDNLFERLSQRSGFLLAAALFAVVAIVVSRLTGWGKSSRSASMAPAVRSRDPFGISPLLTAADAMRKHYFFEWCREVLDNPGRTVELRALGVRLVITDNPDNVQAALSTHFSSYGKGELLHHIWKDVALDSIFVLDGQPWHDQKRYLRNHVAPIRTTDFAIIEKHAQRLIHLWSDHQVHEVTVMVDRLILDIGTDIWFGESTSSLLSGQSPVKKAMDQMFMDNTTKHLLGGFAKYAPENKKAQAVVRSVLDKFIDNAESWDTEPDSEEKTRKQNSLVGLLMAQKTPRKEMYDQMMTILIGGKDPSSLTITWSLYALACHPDMVRKLREEIETVVGFSRPPDGRDLEKMTYLHNIVQETLRVYPPLGWNIKTALEDTFLPTGGGPDGTQRVDIPKGTHTMLSTVTQQRRHDLIGPDADEFKPERWENWKPDMWNYYPFNHGPRICLGRKFGVMEAEFVLCRIFQRFRAVEFTGTKMGMRVILNLKPSEPVTLRFTE